MIAAQLESVPSWHNGEAVPFRTRTTVIHTSIWVGEEMYTAMDHEDVVRICPVVDLDEMAFAIALFVGAANGHVAPNYAWHLASEIGIDTEPVLVGAKSVLLDAEEQLSDELPLARAFAVLWQHYAGDPRRQSICSRLIAFYSMMVRSHGGAVEQWVQATDDPTKVLLDSSVVEAVATAPLSDKGQFNDNRFVKVVEAFSKRDSLPNKSEGTPKEQLSFDLRRIATIKTTERVRELAKYLVAFESCIASPPRTPGILEFRIFARLCKPFAAISGNQGLQPLLVRALESAHLDYPWLETARVSLDGEVQGLGSLGQSLSEGAAAAGELAMIASLVELLRTFLGDGVTMQLLRSIWPLVTLIQLDDQSASQ